MKWFIPLMFMPLHAHAGPYVELGIGSKFGACDCPRLENPVGLVSAGYDFRNGIRFDIEHRSSLVQKDYGTNLVSIKYRYEFRKR